MVASDIPQTAPGLGVLQEMAVFQEDAHVPPMKIIAGGDEMARPIIST